MIENTTEYTLNILKDFIKFSIKRSKTITFVSSIIILLCAIIEFLFKEFVMAAIFSVIGIFFFIMALCLVPISLKKATTMPNITNSYQFLPERLIVTTYSKKDNLGSSTIHYSRITKVVEKNNCLYLYFNKVQALLVDIKTFKECTDKEVVKAYIKNTQELNNKK